MSPRAPDALCFVLHAHLPFVRHAEDEDFLEEDWLHEAVIESYVPLFSQLLALRDAGTDFRIAIGVSPTLVAMLDDPLLRTRRTRRLATLQSRVATAREGSWEKTHHAALLHHAERFDEVQRVLERWNGDVLAPLMELAKSGHVELISESATHGLLPLFSSRASQKAQIQIGRADFVRRFNGTAAGHWLAECGFAPGNDLLLADDHVSYFLAESGAVTNATPQGDVLFPVKTSTGVVILGRDPECAAQVWNARIGFPGDPAYRERYRDLGCDAPLSSQPRAIGIKLHRVTGKDVPASEKAPYDPSAALRRTQEHARIFVDARIAQLKRSAETGRQRVITACYDAELFGHWWYEGPLFLCEVLRLLSSEKQLSAVAPSQLESIPSSEASVEPACSTWGAGSSHQVWLGPQNEWLYRYQHAAERGMNELLQRFGDNRDDYSRRTIQQCGRELLLLQASDWAFMLATGSHASYARRRFTEHFQAFRQLHDTLLTTAPEPDFLSDRERATPIFPQLSVDAWR